MYHGREFTLDDLIFIIRKRFITIALFAISAFFFAYFVSEYLITPVYEGSANIFIIQKGSKTISSLELILKKQTLMEKVSMDSGIAIGADSISERVTINKIGSAEVFAIKVRDSNPAYADAILSSIIRLAPQEISETLEIEPFEIVLLSKGVVRISPDVSFNSLAGLFIGLIASCVYIFILELLNNRMVTVENIEEILGYRTLGVIPKVRIIEEGTLVGIEQRSLSERESDSLIESYYALRANLLSVTKNRVKKLMIASSLPDEGRTAIAINLAILLGRTGKKTLLIEADLRNPSVANYLDIDSDQGLTDVLTGGVSAENAVFDCEDLCFSVLPAGPAMNRPNDALGSDPMRALISKLEDEYDYILFDTPPLSVYSDALTLMPDIDGVLFVVRHDATKDKIAIFSKHSIDTIGANVIGCVTNMFDAKKTNNMRTY